jgi:ribose 5-phosphate isomerase A
MNPKQHAAEAALAHLRDNMTVGLGTGSTADFFLQALAAHLRDGRLRNIKGIPTSRQSESRARELNIPLTTLAEHPDVDLTVDGADEIDPHLNLIKGLGGALLREKIVAQNSARLIIIADESKLVKTLGTKSPLPVEVTPFAHEAQVRFLQSLGATPTLRANPDGSPFVTDNHNHIYDCRFASIPHPAELQLALKQRAGIVESGLFLGIASLVLTSDGQKVTTHTP